MPAGRWPPAILHQSSSTASLRCVGFLRACVVFAALAASTAWADPFANAASTFAAPHPAVVRVVSPESDGVSYGSGSLVAVDETSGLVLTNWHVVRDAAGPIVVYFPDGFRSRAVLLRVDRDWDLAALAIRRPNVQPIPLATQAPQPGDPLTIIGYGSGSYRAVTGRCTEYVSPGGRPSRRNGRTLGPGTQRRLGRTDPQQPRRIGRRAVRHGLRTHDRQLLRPAARVPGLGRRRFSHPFQSGDAGRPIAPGRLAPRRRFPPACERASVAGNSPGNAPQPTAVATAPLLPLPSLSTLPSSPASPTPKHPPATDARPMRAESVPSPAPPPRLECGHEFDGRPDQDDSGADRRRRRALSRDAIARLGTGVTSCLLTADRSPHRLPPQRTPVATLNSIISTQRRLSWHYGDGIARAFIRAEKSVDLGRPPGPGSYSKSGVALPRIGSTIRQEASTASSRVKSVGSPWPPPPRSRS